VPVGMRWWEWVLSRGRCDPTKPDRAGQAVTRAVQCERAVAGGCKKRVDHESTGACSGDGGAAAATQERAGRWESTQRQRQRQGSLTHTLSRDRTSGGEGNADTRRPCCLLLCPEAAEIARTAQG
jgi:hypothetical protein